MAQWLRICLQWRGHQTDPWSQGWSRSTAEQLEACAPPPLRPCSQARTRRHPEPSCCSRWGLHAQSRGSVTRRRPAVRRPAVRRPRGEARPSGEAGPAVRRPSRWDAPRWAPPRWDAPAVRRAPAAWGETSPRWGRPRSQLESSPSHHS